MILEALEKNPKLSAYATRRIAEYRRHLVVEEEEEEDEEEYEYEDEDGEYEDSEYEDDDEDDDEYEDEEDDGFDLLEDLDQISEEELQAAIDEIKASVEPEGELDTDTGLSEAQVRQLPPPMRAKLARGASRSLRIILIKDPKSDSGQISAHCQRDYRAGDRAGHQQPFGDGRGAYRDCQQSRVGTQVQHHGTIW